MSNEEIEEIVAYLNKLLDDLFHKDFGFETLQLELAKLNKVIAKLTKASVESADEKSRMFFASIEYNAKQYRNNILERLDGTEE
jgi:hypothetical protein